MVTIYKNDKRVKLGLSLKEKVRHSIFPIIAQIIHFFGFSWEKIGFSKIGKMSLLAQSKAIMKDKELDIGRAINPKKITFVTMLAGHTYNVSIDVSLALCLRARGHEVSLIINDKYLPITQEITQADIKTWAQISSNNFYFGRRYLQNWELDVINISSIADTYKYKGEIDFKEIVEASLLRHYKVGVLSDDLPNLDEVTSMIERSISITSNVGEYIVKSNPDVVIMSHGIYSTWGPPFKILQEAKIPTLTYGRGKKAGTSKFNWDCTADWWDVTEEWNRLKDRSLTAYELKRIKDYLESRIKQDKDVFVYNFGELEDKQKTYDRFGLDPNKITYSLFTNVLWDAASAQREIVFTNPIEWALETIRWAGENPQIQLIVKIHPSEVVIGTNMRFKDVINEELDEIPSNVRLIEPHEEVNSWSIYKVTDLGIVHTTTVGMELPLEGIPCVVVSKTHFRGKAFTVDLSTKEEYFTYLANFDKTKIDKTILRDLAMKYAYLLFERYQMPLDLFNESVSTDVRSLRFESIKELYNKPTINKVINAIETGEKSILNTK